MLLLCGVHLARQAISPIATLVWFVICLSSEHSWQICMPFGRLLHLGCQETCCARWHSLIPQGKVDFGVEDLQPKLALVFLWFAGGSFDVISCFTKVPMITFSLILRNNKGVRWKWFLILLFCRDCIFGWWISEYLWLLGFLTYLVLCLLYTENLFKKFLHARKLWSKYSLEIDCRCLFCEVWHSLFIRKREGGWKKICARPEKKNLFECRQKTAHDAEYSV